MKKALIVGVMGGGKADAKTEASAYLLGSFIAGQGWIILLNGGRNTGVMEASARGAFENGGTTIGILPDADTRQVSMHAFEFLCAVQRELNAYLPA